jgi:hypothetical protein
VLQNKEEMKKSQFVSLVAVFAAFNVVADALMGPPGFTSGIWYGWIYLVAPITGILIGPYAGSLSTFIGVMAGHFISPRNPYEFLFTLGAPLGAMVSGFIFRGKWKNVLLYYTALLAIYFLTPVAWQLPLWGMWDVYVAYLLLLTVALLMAKAGPWNLESKGLLYALVTSSFIGLEADVLFRIFILVPGQTYRLFYGWTAEVLIALWSTAGFITPIKVAISILVTTIVGFPLVRILGKSYLRYTLNLKEKRVHSIRND